MSLFFCDGMSTYLVGQQKYDVATNVLIHTSGGRNGRPYLEVTGGGGEAQKIVAPGPIWIVGFAYSVQVGVFQLAGTFYRGNQFLPATTADTLISMSILPDLTLGMFVGTTPVCSSGTKGISIFAGDGWNYVEFTYILSSRPSTVNPLVNSVWATGEIRIATQLVSAPLGTYVDSGIVTNSTMFMNATVNSHQWNRNGGFFLSDVYAIDNGGHFNAYGNDVAVNSTFPIADGVDTDWSGSFASIDGNPPSGVGGIVPSAAPSYSNYKFGPLSLTFPGTIAAVMLWALASSDNGTDYLQGYLGNPHDFLGSEYQPYANVFFYYGFPFDENYDTAVNGPWTPANFNAEYLGFLYHV